MTQMQDTIFFYSDYDSPGMWHKALLAEMPDARFTDNLADVDPADVTVAVTWKPPTGFFTPFRNLRLVVNLGAGVDALVGRDDLPDVPIMRLADQGMVSLMTSYVLFAVIRYARDIDKFEEAQRAGEWRYIHPRALSEVSVAVLGLGELGSAAAMALSGLGLNVLGWSRSPKQIEGVRCFSGLNALPEVLSRAEIAVIMLPITPETRQLINRDRLRLLPRGAKLVNAARGAVVDETAMIEALRDGHLGGATLDVFETEPLPEASPLWRMTNVLITPHLASITIPESSARDVAESIRRVRSGLPPLHLIDPARGY